MAEQQPEHGMAGLEPQVRLSWNSSMAWEALAAVPYQVTCPPALAPTMPVAPAMPRLPGYSRYGETTARTVPADPGTAAAQ